MKWEPQGKGEESYVACLRKEGEKDFPVSVVFWKTSLVVILDCQSDGAFKNSISLIENFIQYILIVVTTSPNSSYIHPDVLTTQLL